MVFIRLRTGKGDNLLAQDILDKAVELRASGLTYKQIVLEMGGVITLDQCKKNLKQVKTPAVKDDQCLLDVIELAIRPEGVSVYEANGIIIRHRKAAGVEVSKEQMRQIRDKAKTRNHECLFRPAWVSTEKPTESYKAFCSYLLHLQDEMDNIIRWYCDSFPEAQQSSVRYEILEYLKPTKDGESLSRRISRTEKLCEQMEERLLKNLHQQSE